MRIFSPLQKNERAHLVSKLGFYGPNQGQIFNSDPLLTQRKGPAQ